jgi:hypothetical protein
MVVVGCFFLTAGLLYLALKLRVSFDTEGGSLGMVPVLDGAVFPPLFVWFGLGIIQRGCGWPGWPWWAFALGWLVSVVVAGWLLARVGESGKQHHQR